MPPIALNVRKIETLIFFLLWALVFSIPFFASRDLEYPDWHRITSVWAHFICYLVIFLINVYLLVPQFLLQKKYYHYAALTLGLILLMTGADILIHMNLFPRQVPRFPGMHRMLRPGMPPPGIKPPILEFTDSLLIGVLIVGAGTTFRLFSRWITEEKLRKDIEKEQLRTNLALLRNQISPHFLMNTLNNIHALVDINSEDAKDAIVRLSTLMRYLLYDSNKGRVSIAKELEFIRSFISLMQLRYSDKVDIRLNLPAVIPDVEIPPMLFLSFLENAFKHGVSYQSESYIHFDLEVTEMSVRCRIRNSKHRQQKMHPDEYSGIGMENIRKSLDLLYSGSYQLVISDREKDFEADLTIPL